MIKSPMANAPGEEIRHCMRLRKTARRFAVEKIFVNAGILSKMPDVKILRSDTVCVTGKWRLPILDFSY